MRHQSRGCSGDALAALPPDGYLDGSRQVLDQLNAMRHDCALTTATPKDARRRRARVFADARMRPRVVSNRAAQRLAALHPQPAPEGKWRTGAFAHDSMLRVAAKGLGRAQGPWAGISGRAPATPL